MSLWDDLFGQLNAPIVPGPTTYQAPPQMGDVAGQQGLSTGSSLGGTAGGTGLSGPGTGAPSVGNWWDPGASVGSPSTSVFDQVPPKSPQTGGTWWEQEVAKGAGQPISFTSPGGQPPSGPSGMLNDFSMQMTGKAFSDLSFEEQQVVQDAFGQYSKNLFAPPKSGGSSGGGGGGAGGPALGYGNMLSYEQQVGLVELKNASDHALKELEAQYQVDIANIEADTTLSVADKQSQTAALRLDADIKIANINAGASGYAAEVSAGARKYEAELQMEEQKLITEAQRDIANGELELGYEKLASAERIEAQRTQVGLARVEADRYASELEAGWRSQDITSRLIGEIMKTEAQDRATRTKGATDIFSTLAQLAPQQNLVNAFYAVRGQQPPPSLAQQTIPVLEQIIGLQPSQSAAITQATAPTSAAPPFMQQLLGQQGAMPAPAAA